MPRIHEYREPTLENLNALRAASNPVPASEPRKEPDPVVVFQDELDELFEPREG
jgi:hypothetical protein